MTPTFRRAARRLRGIVSEARPDDRGTCRARLSRQSTHDRSPDYLQNSRARCSNSSRVTVMYTPPLPPFLT